MISAEERYDHNPDLSMFYQGDVVRDVPFPTWPTFDPENKQSKWAILRPWGPNERSLEEFFRALPNKLVGRAASDVPDAFAHAKREFIIGRCTVQNVLVASRSCSLDNPHRKHFLVAPVISVDSLPEAQKGPDKLADLREGNIPHFFYLPGRDNLREGYADLLKLTPVHRSFFDPLSISQKLAARLSSVGMMELQYTLSNHFGKQFGFDHEDVCPQDGLYSCSNCFHSGNSTSHVTFRAGSAFGPCPRCGESAAFVKMPVTK